LRAGALLIGVALHATLTFLPNVQLWILRDQPSTTLAMVFFIVHIFRMPVFFLIAGFFARFLYERRGPRGFIRDRAVRIAAPFFVFFPLVGAATAACAIWAVRSTGQQFGVAGQARPEISLSTFPLGHLWFLYVLILLYAATLLTRAVVGLLDRDGRWRAGSVDRAMQLLTAGPWASWVLAAPLAAAFVLSESWRGWLGIEPPAFGFVPNNGALAGFGAAFAFGWLLHRQQSLFSALQRWWVVQIMTAVPLTAFCSLEVGVTPSLDFTPRDTAGIVYAVCYALAVWTWTLGLTGAALRYLNAERPVIRYLADASYWIYIIHLPVLAIFQVGLYWLPVPPLIKYPLILTAAVAILLLSYELLVRHSFLGRWLNGRKYPRRQRSALASVQAD
jgi:peptidoglycan/LPS O-acetylase OafA/YrhL